MIGGEVPVGRAKGALQLDGVTLRERHHGLKPERGRFGGVRPGNLAPRASDFGRAIQDKPPAHPGIGAGIDLEEQRRAEVVGAIDRRDEAVVAGVEGPLVVVVGVVDGDLRPGVDGNVVVVVGVALGAGQPGLVDDAGGVVDAQPVEEGAAVGRDRKAEAVRAEQPEQRAGRNAGLQREAEIVTRGLLVHRVEQIPGAALGHGLRGPERGVELGRERVRRIRRRAEPEQGEVLQRRRRCPGPVRAVVGQQQALVIDLCPPAGPWRQAQPCAVGPERDVQVPARPVARCAGGDDVSVAVGGASGWRGQVPVEDGELDEPAEQPQRLVVDDMFLDLHRQDVREQQMRSGVGHGALRM